jgi:xanthine dehydrogenase accessory factor
MPQILEQLEVWRGEGTSLALATLVRVSGSAPRLSGAHMVVAADGRFAGSVSGGCVESDIVDRCLQALASEQCELVNYGLADNNELGVGLQCGSIDVFIEPYAETAASAALAQDLATETSVASAVVVSPGPLQGRRMTVRADGSEGSLDAGVDELVATKAQRELGRPSASLQAVSSSAGEVEVFVQVFARRPRLYLVGATHIASALCPLAKLLGFHVTVVDARTIFSTQERFGEADEILRLWPDEAFPDGCLGPDSYVVTLSHDSKFDVPALARALAADTAYIGALGSRATHARRVEKLRELGFADADLARVHSPVGLDIGARRPEEIALAVLAEIVAVGTGREGGLLRNRKAPIHDPA